MKAIAASTSGEAAAIWWTNMLYSVRGLYDETISHDICLGNLQPLYSYHLNEFRNRLKMDLEFTPQARHKYIDTPALVFGQVPVENVVLVQGQEIDPLLDPRNGVEETGAIEHETAPTETRRVLDSQGGQRYGFGVEELEKALRAIEKAACGAGLDGYGGRRYLKRVGFGSLGPGDRLEGDGILCCGTNWELQAKGTIKLFGKEFGHGPGSR